MGSFALSVLAAAIALCVPVAAFADMSKAEHLKAQKTIDADHKSARAACEPLAANAKDICVAGAQGQERVARAELEAAYKPTVKARYDARLARIEADYAVAMQRCDDKSGNAKELCVVEAKAVRTDAKTEARLRMQTAEADKAIAGKP